MKVLFSGAGGFVGGVIARMLEPMTRFVAAQLGTLHHYHLTAARRDFGYEPLVSAEEAHRRTVAWLQGELSAQVPLRQTAPR